MVQVKGIARLLTHRFSKDFEGRVKYSTLWPSRMDWPWAARRAIPTRRGCSGRGSKGREAMGRFAVCSPRLYLECRRVKRDDWVISMGEKRLGCHSPRVPFPHLVPDFDPAGTRAPPQLAINPNSPCSLTRTHE